MYLLNAGTKCAYSKLIHACVQHDFRNSKRNSVIVTLCIIGFDFNYLYEVRYFFGASLSTLRLPTLLIVGLGRPGGRRLYPPLPFQTLRMPLDVVVLI